MTASKYSTTRQPASSSAAARDLATGLWQFFASPRRNGMTRQARAAVDLLAAEAIRRDGTLPADDAEQRDIAGLDEATWENERDAIMACFHSEAEQPVLPCWVEHQAHQAHISHARRLAAQRRWGPQQKATATAAHHAEPRHDGENGHASERSHEARPESDAQPGRTGEPKTEPRSGDAQPTTPPQPTPQPTRQDDQHAAAMAALDMRQRAAAAPSTLGAIASRYAPQEQKPQAQQAVTQQAMQLQKSAHRLRGENLILKTGAERAGQASSQQPDPARANGGRPSKPEQAARRLQLRYWRADDLAALLRDARRWAAEAASRGADLADHANRRLCCLLAALRQTGIVAAHELEALEAGLGRSRNVCAYLTGACKRMLRDAGLDWDGVTKAFWLPHAWRTAAPTNDILAAA